MAASLIQNRSGQVLAPKIIFSFLKRYITSETNLGIKHLLQVSIRILNQFSLISFTSPKTKCSITFINLKSRITGPTIFA